MNNIDIAVLTIIFLSVLIGFVKGGLSHHFKHFWMDISNLGNHYVFKY